MGGSRHQEYWIPADELAAFNSAIIGKIEVIGLYYAPLGPTETELRGDLNPAAHTRIGYLMMHVLRKVATADEGWSTLYQDPADGRYWEMTYPFSAMHGGGPMTLTYMSDAEAAKKYGDVS